MKIMGLEISVLGRRPREKRKAERARVYNSLSVDYEGPDPTINGFADAIDISSAGVRFASYSNFPQGTPLNLTLRFAPEYTPDKVLQARGTVIRCYRKPEQRRYRVACTFENLDPPSRNEIRAFVSWLKERNKHYFYFPFYR